MKRALLIYFIFLLNIWLVGVYAQTPLFTPDNYTRFKNITILQGLSSNRVLDIIQDKYGYMWVATTDGLNRFDGYKFRVFKHNADDSTSISDNYITSLTIDNNGLLWIGTKNGLNRYISEDESFYRYPLHSFNKKGLSHAYVRKVYNSKKNGVLWVETNDGVLNKINTSKGTIKHYKHEKNQTDFYDYHSIFEDINGNIWLGGRGFGPYVFDTATQYFKLLKADSKNPLKKRDNDIACIFQDSHKRFWMSATDGFYQYFPERDEFKKWLATSTYNIIESGDNQLWLASGNGLFKFNIKTKKFTTFRYNQNNGSSIGSNNLSCVFLDANNNLWVGTSKGISVLHVRENAFRHYHHIAETKGALSFDKVSSFLQDSDNDIWIGTMGGGINLWDRGTDSFYDYKKEFGNKKVSCLYEDSYNDIWIGLWSGRGFYRFNKSKQQFSHYALNYHSLKQDWYNGFFEDNKKRLWVGFWGAYGIQIFDRKQNKFEPYILNIAENPVNKTLKLIEVDNNSIWCYNYINYIHRYNIKQDEYEAFVNVEKDGIFPEWRENNRINITGFKRFGKIVCTAKLIDGEVLFATDKGLIIHKNESFREINNPLLNNIKAVYAQQHYVFIATDKHLLKIDINDESIKVLFSIKNEAALNNASINRIFVDGNKTFFGTSSGLFIYNIKAGVFLCNNGLKNQNCLNKPINDIKKGNGQNYWIATESGMVVLNSKYKVVAHYNIENSFGLGLISENIYSILPNKNGKSCWLGTEKGLVRFNNSDSSFNVVDQLADIPIYQVKAGKRETLWLATEIGLVHYFVLANSIITHYKKSKHQLTSRLTQFIYKDNSGYIWVGTTNNGLNRFDTVNYEITHFLSEPDKAGSFWGDHASCVFECADGTLLFGGKGINIYDKKKEQFRHITTNNGLVSNNILGITQDKNGMVWVSTDKGLMRINLKNRKIDVFAEDWGLQPHEFNRALKKLGTGEILIASDKGFCTFCPNKIDSVKSSHKIEITGFKIFDKQVRTDFTTNKNVVLRYDENFFTFEFSDFNFINSKAQYLYMLEGIDKNWVSPDNVNFASYTNILPGNYRFLVTTKQNLAQGFKPEGIKILITPPFWKTIWFYLLEVIVVLAIMVFLYTQRIKSYKLREKHMQLEQKMLRSQMNPHFVFNALIAIQSFILKNNPREAGRYLSKFAKLMRLFLQNTRHEYIPLSNELETLVFYMELQQLRFSDSFEFKINIIDEIDPEQVQIPPMMAQPFIENAIEHGFKGIGYKGLIEIDYSFIGDSLLISIKDNGKGIDKALKESDSKKHDSLATTITQERLTIFSGKSSIYTLHITDLSKLDKKLNGTEVLINVPYKDYKL